jgi:flavin reductase (DIM6/NTAB) family NADH-FMN oxidoreductase RutF
MQQTKAIAPAKNWQECDIAKDFEGSAIERISKDWMLITAGGAEDWNTMTASWGGIGYLWQKSVAFVFVRPTRHTYEFSERAERLTLSFFDQEIKARVHKICGNKSGRDTDKAREAMITPVTFGEGIVGFDEAREVIVCRKLYAGRFDPANFIDPEIEQYYPIKDYHRVYIGEIERFLKRVD